MNENQTESKPADAEQESGKGLDETACSASGFSESGTGSHNARAERSNNHSAYDPQMHLGIGHGIVIWGKSGSIIVGRDGRKSQPGMAAPGITNVIKNSRHFYRDILPHEIKEGKIALLSLVSFHDVLNVIRHREHLRRANLIVGGPACHNIQPLIGIASAANFGRCDGNKIDRIIAGQKLASVWRSDDPTLSQQYDVDQDIHLAKDEHAVGCKLKCTFCFYSWWNGFKTSAESASYTSGFAPYEDFWKTLDWRKAVRGAVTALDGFAEETRKRILKPNSVDRLVSKILDADAVDTETLLRVKVYLIAGYPWETQADLETLDLIDACRIADEKLKRAKIVIRLHLSHFIPFPKTPLWDVPYNLTVNARQWGMKNKILFEGRRIVVHSGGAYAPHPATGAASCCVMRATRDDVPLLDVIASPKFQNSSADDRLAWLVENCPHLLGKQTRDPVFYVRTPHDALREKVERRHVSKPNAELCQPCPPSTPPHQETAAGQGLA
jgi:hypothetical protein